MVDRASDYMSQVKEIVGDEFVVEIANPPSGALLVRKDDDTKFRIFQSEWAGRRFAVSLYDKKYMVIAKKVAEDLELDLGAGFD